MDRKIKSTAVDCGVVVVVIIIMKYYCLGGGGCRGMGGGRMKEYNVIKTLRKWRSTCTRDSGRCARALRGVHYRVIITYGYHTTIDDYVMYGSV